MSVLRVLDAGSLAGGALNEDAYGVACRAGWVLDGATGLGRNVVATDSDAAWFASEFSRELHRVLVRCEDRDLAGLVEEALEGLAAAYVEALGGAEIAAFEFPSAAGMILRIAPTAAELLWLGDCRAFWREQGALKSTGGGALQALDEQGLGALREFFAAEPQATLAEARAAVWPLLQRLRTLMNQPEGYWIWAPRRNLAARAERAQMPRGVGPVLLASDGFTRLWDTFSIATPEEALEACARGQGLKLARALREAETADENARRALRFKQFDDCTWLCVQV